MKIRNVFVVVMLVLVVALFLYLLGGMGTKQESAVTEQTSAAAVSASGADNVQSVSEADAKLEELKKQQGATSRSGLSRLYLVKCSACHGRDGRGPIGPSIVGKSKEENIAVLQKYKMKQISNSAMIGLLEQTSDQEIEKLAEEIATF
jgi:cytochrome c553